MTKILLLSVLFFSSFYNFCTQTVETKNEKFQIEKLSPEGQEAYKKLLQAEEFQDARVGEGGELSEFVNSLNILAKEKDADDAFKALLKNATVAGQLYALCGLYYTDYDFFRKAVEKYRNDKTLVKRMSGCEKFNDKVAEIVDSKAQNVAIIPPNETMQDWWSKNKLSYETDIFHGGFPAHFRYEGLKKK